MLLWIAKPLGLGIWGIFLPRKIITEDSGVKVGGFVSLLNPYTKVRVFGN